MAKLYMVNTGEGNTIGVKTLKQVSEILGVKVAKKDVEDGMIPDVEYKDVDLTEDMLEELEETGQVEFDVEDNMENEDELEENIDSEDDNEDNEDEEDSEDSNEDEQDMEDEEDIDEDIEDEEEDNEEDSEDEEDSEEEDNEPNMAELLAKLKKNNEKIAKENPEKSAKDKKKRAKVELKTDENGDIIFPEKGYFKDENDIKKYYKQLDNDQLDEWLALEGLEYSANEHAGIDRMRKCMAIKDYHFPKETTTKKSKSKYGDLETEELLQMALDNDIEVKDGKGNLKILRMYVIMALREAGLLE